MSHDEEQTRLTEFLDAGLPEYRSVPFLDFEAKDDGWSFEGLAAVYGQEADLGDFTEEFRHGAFRKPLAQGDNTRLIYEHSPPHLPLLATIKGGTLQLKDDVKGLVVRGQIAQHYLGEAVRELINRGDIKGMSPGMIVGRGNSDVTMRSNGKMHRAIRALKHLPEVSLTSDPAYAGTTAELRSLWWMRMAESLDLPQHAFMGSYQQLEGRAETPPEGTQTESAEPVEPPTTVVEETPDDAEPAETEAPPEQRSGVADAQAEAAARRRRLQMLGLQLP